MFNENINIFLSITGLFLTVFAAVWSLAWWLSGHFTEIRRLVYETSEKTRAVLLEKLEYHERHDDTRFASIRSDISDIRVRNAASDALLVLREKALESKA